jgi:SpoVK/Ycf46/Vps4 family AAA+-type ATPase
MEQLVKTLEERGIRTYLPAKDDGDSGGPGEKDSTHVDWRGLAGYESQKRQIEENLLLPLRRPEVFDSIARKTRTHYASNRPRALLFTGPPGTGKTSSARVISRAAGVPLCYVPLEAIASKWYGESEKKLAEALEMIDSGFPNGAVIFIDELDSLATTRGSDMHEATRRMLGVLLRYLDGFDQNKRAVVVGATNVPGDLVGIDTDLYAPTDSQTLRLSDSLTRAALVQRSQDPALRSRFSANIEFGLPDEQCRVEILKQYSQQLSEDDVRTLAKATAGFSGRDLRDACSYAERHWATCIIKGAVKDGSTPGLKVYLEAVRARRA